MYNIYIYSAHFNYCIWYNILLYIYLEYSIFSDSKLIIIFIIDIRQQNNVPFNIIISSVLWK